MTASMPPSWSSFTPRRTWAWIGHRRWPRFSSKQSSAAPPPTYEEPTRPKRSGSSSWLAPACADFPRRHRSASPARWKHSLDGSRLWPVITNSPSSIYAARSAALTTQGRTSASPKNTAGQHATAERKLDDVNTDAFLRTAGAASGPLAPTTTTPSALMSSLPKSMPSWQDFRRQGSQTTTAHDGSPYRRPHPLRQQLQLDHGHGWLWPQPQAVGTCSAHVGGGTTWEHPRSTLPVNHYTDTLGQRDARLPKSGETVGHALIYVRTVAYARR